MLPIVQIEGKATEAQSHLDAMKTNFSLPLLYHDCLIRIHMLSRHFPQMILGNSRN